MKKLLVAVSLLLSFECLGQNNDAGIGIVPAPVSVVKDKGKFTITPETSFLVDSPGHKAVRYLAAYLKANGYNNGIVNLNTMGRKPETIKNAVLVLTAGSANLPEEGYSLDINDNQAVVIGKRAGLFYGVQSLTQMFRSDRKGYATLQAVHVKDYPRFKYRGMHLDVARHFFSVDFIKKYLDVMAMYKLNNFHWHLTDDQGWRLEIKKYPKLVTVGATRAQTRVGKGGDAVYDNTPYTGYYTQDQVREIVAYAADRYINIVPEIEMPGHSLAAIAAYPEMSCDAQKKYKVGEEWGVVSDVYCPSEVTFKMLGEILDEVVDLFPGKYIHLGGDECPKDAWKQSAFCQDLIKDSSLNDENGVQSYFIRRISRHLNAMGRSVIGWDEILEGGLAPNATVMSWRGEDGGIAAAKQDHDVIMTPSSQGLYFDHAQSKSPQEPLTIGGLATLEKTYAYDPIPAALEPDQQKHIIGVQANLWTEYIATPAKAEYMLLPRMLALSEVAWSQNTAKDFNGFSTSRIPHQLAILEGLGYNFRVPEPQGISDTSLNGTNFTLDGKPGVEGGKVFYTIDGFTPRETDLWFAEPVRFMVPRGKGLEVQAITITPLGKRSNVTKMQLDNSK